MHPIRIPSTKRTAIIVTVTIIAAAVLSCKSSQTHQESSLVTTTASPSFIKAIGYVTDDANVVDEASRKQLETTLAALKARKRIDFSVVIMKTTGDQSVRDYSLAIARERKAITKKKTLAASCCSWRLTIVSGTFKSLATSRTF